MVTYTPILKLAQPVFDQEPWDADINGDMAIIDSALGSFFTIPGYIGIWQNNHLYAQGQTATDATDSSLWYCNVSHTSTISPYTFAQDRVTNPLNWTNQIPNGSDLADAANAAAIAAANSAAAAAASAAEAAAAAPNAVLKSGSTMTGPLVLSGDPSDVKGAATKQYVDARVGGTGFLPTTGGTITGNLAVTGSTQLGSNVRAYTAGQIPEFYGFNQAYNAAAGFHVDNSGNCVFGTYDGGGSSVFTRGYVSPGGNFIAAGQMNALHFIASSQVQWGGLGSLWVDGSSNNIQFTTDGWKWQFTRSNGQMTYRNNGGQDLFHITGNGHIQSNGNYLSLANRIGVQNASTPVVYAYNTSLNQSVGMWCDSAGQMRLGFTDPAGSPISYLATLGSNGISLNNDGGISFYKVGNNTNLQFNINTTLMQYDAGTDTFSFYRYNGTCPFQLRSFDSAIVNYVGPVVATSFSPISDARFKTNVIDITKGLDVLMQLRPVEFDWIANNRHDCGFIAQEVDTVYDEAVTITGVPTPDGDGGLNDPNPSLGLDNSTMVALLVKSVQELTARVQALEAAR
jgi:hypothetical protein